MEENKIEELSWFQEAHIYCVEEAIKNLEWDWYWIKWDN